MNNTMTENELARILLEGVPFQPGDIVECVDASYTHGDLEQGNVYTISGTNAKSSTVAIELCDMKQFGHFRASRFRYYFPP